LRGGAGGKNDRQHAPNRRFVKPKYFTGAKLPTDICWTNQGATGEVKFLLLARSKE